MATRERSKWLVRTQRIPWAAMLFSEQTRQFYGLPIDMLPACPDITADRTLMHLSEAFRHEHRDLFAQ